MHPESLLSGFSDKFGLPKLFANTFFVWNLRNESRVLVCYFPAEIRGVVPDLFFSRRVLDFAGIIGINLLIVQRVIMT